MEPQEAPEVEPRERMSQQVQRLAMPAEQITMDAVVEALEGQIAPMECFHETPEGRVLCSHEEDNSAGGCATKLLWTSDAKLAIWPRVNLESANLAKRGDPAAAPRTASCATFAIGKVIPVTSLPLALRYTCAAIVLCGGRCRPVPAVPAVAPRGLERVLSLGQGADSVRVPNEVLVA